MFKFEKREKCPCGTQLNEASPKVIKTTTFGEVVFRQCADCGSWLQSPQLTMQSLMDWFDSDEYQGGANHRGSIYANYLDDEPIRILEAEGRYKRDIHPWIPSSGAEILEIGCATGSLLSVIRKHGHNVQGIDLSSRFVASARELHQLNVLEGDFLGADFLEEHFDMIVVLGSICNFSDLNLILLKINRLLKKGGVLFFNCPIADSWIAKIYGERFWMFTPSINSFMTSKCCHQVINKAGLSFKIEKNDWQQPSWEKVLNHTKLSSIIRINTQGTLPLAIPIPGVRTFIAQKNIS